MRALSDLTTLIVLNLLTILCSIPIVTAGAAYTALHYCIMHMVDGDAHIAKEYIKQFKLNLKSSTPVWLVFLFSAAFIWLDYKLFVPEDGSFSVMLVILYAIIFILAVLFVWIFPLMARIENAFSARFKNAAILAVGHLPRTMIMVAFQAVAVFVFTQEIRIVPIAFALGLSLPAYLCTLIYHPVIKDLIERMQGGTKASDETEESEPDITEE